MKINIQKGVSVERHGLPKTDGYYLVRTQRFFLKNWGQVAEYIAEDKQFISENDDILENVTHYIEIIDKKGAKDSFDDAFLQGMNEGYEQGGNDGFIARDTGRC